MAPRSWIEARRLTITLRAAMRSAPRDRVTVVIIGRSSGVRPTASATENSSDSSTGRPNSTCVVRTTRTRAMVRRAVSRPNACRSRWNGEGAWASASDEAAAPNRVARPVPTTSASASPVCATAPRNRALQASPALRAVTMPGALFDRIGLAGQRRLAGGEGRRLEHQRIGRNDVAGAHPHDVARHDGVDFDPHEGAIALDLGLERHRAAQDFGRLDGAAFLEGVEADRKRQDRHDDGAADAIAGRRRHDAGRQENQRQRLEQSPQDRAGYAGVPRGGVGVGTVLF